VRRKKAVAAAQIIDPAPPASSTETTPLDRFCERHKIDYAEYCPRCDEEASRLHREMGDKKKKVDETSADLGRALESGAKREEKDRAESTRALVWESANAPKKVPLPGGFAYAVERIFLQDAEIPKVWERLEKILKLGDGRTEHGLVLRALDEAEKNSRQANKLYVTAKVVQEDYERENNVVFATLWAESTKLLQAEKEAGRRNKTITDKDVEMKCAELFPDEYRSQERSRSRAKATVESLKHLVEAWESRCRSLNTMAGRR